MTHAISSTVKTGYITSHDLMNQKFKQEDWILLYTSHLLLFHWVSHFSCLPPPDLIVHSTSALLANHLAAFLSFDFISLSILLVLLLCMPPPPHHHQVSVSSALSALVNMFLQFPPPPVCGCHGGLVPDAQGWCH